MNTLWRWSKRAALMRLALAALVALVAYGVLCASLAELDGQSTLASLDAAVQVQRDAQGVPTITATSRLDLARATGYVHGQERFFQMDLMRRDAAGELSELFGGAALAYDKRRRLHGLKVVAHRAVKSLNEADRRMLQAYAAGVNAGLGALDAKPFEYFLVNQTPRLWALEDTILAIHAMWITLTDEAAERDLNLTRMHDVLPPEVYAYLAQVGSKQDAALDGSAWSSLPIPAAQVYDARRFGETLVHSAILPVALHRDAHLEGLQGSNNWAVMGRRSTHGGAIVANDMHLSLRVPNLWFRARFVIPGLLDISGYRYRVRQPSLPEAMARWHGDSPIRM